MGSAGCHHPQHCDCTLSPLPSIPTALGISSIKTFTLDPFTKAKNPAIYSQLSSKGRVQTGLYQLLREPKVRIVKPVLGPCSRCQVWGEDLAQTPLPLENGRFVTV